MSNAPIVRHQIRIFRTVENVYVIVRETEAEKFCAPEFPFQPAQGSCIFTRAYNVDRAMIEKESAKWSEQHIPKDATISNVSAPAIQHRCRVFDSMPHLPLRTKIQADRRFTMFWDEMLEMQSERINGVELPAGKVIFGKIHFSCEIIWHHAATYLFEQGVEKYVTKDIRECLIRNKSTR